VTAPEGGAYSYEPFARHRFYEAVNRSLVEEGLRALDPGAGPLTIADLSCGTGAMTALIVEALGRRARDARIVAVDPSPESLAEAELRLAGAAAELRFVVGDAADLAGALGGAADAVFFGNAIHLVADKDRALAEIGAALRRGGVLAFNSSYFEGAYPAGSAAFYRLWTVRALRRLRARRPDVRVARQERAAARRLLSPGEYADALRRAGFRVRHLGLEEALMGVEAFQDIGRYRLFIEGALPGVPLDAGADALAHGAAEAFAELGLEHVPRNWLQVVAVTGG
jgi:ubiquinone/menaquinone biosynthesis C-methylase UbiE